MFDTHQVVKNLKAVGFSKEQAEAVAQVVRDSHNLDLSNLATKTDLAETTVELIKWGVGISLAQAGFVMAILRFMH